MAADLVVKAVEAAQKLSMAKRGRRFQTAVQEFVRVLKTVPDCGVGELMDGGLEALPILAEGVIDRIERRLADRRDRASIRLALATAIYDIRNAIEETNRRYRHFARAGGRRS